MLKVAEIDELMKNYNGEVLQELVKEAAIKNPMTMGKLWSETWPRVVTGVAAAGTLFAIDRLFLDKILDYLEKRKTTRESREYFEKMLSNHPQLKEYEPETVAKYWESLYHFAPMMAQDPLAAGAYITQSLKRQYIEEFGGPTLDIFKTLTEVQKNSRPSDRKSSLLHDATEKAVMGAMVFDGSKDKSKK